MLPPPKWLRKEDPAYSSLLREMRGHPDQLSYIGVLDALETPSVSIIGSRKMSVYGERVAREIVPTLVRAGLTVVSGLAYGIDSLCHRLTLQEGGRCIAVLGGGFNHFYPAAHLPMAREILTNGCLLSEYELDEPPLREHFPERNRIVAGLSPFTLIIEAAARSGTLSTARHALNAGRDVGVVPGDIFAEQSAGVHQLLWEGAHPVTCAQDVLDVYGIGVPLPTPPKLQGAEAAVYNLIQPTGKSFDQLQAGLGWPAAELQRILSSLELDGHLHLKHSLWQKT